VRTLEILKQGVNQPLSVERQVVSLYIGTRGHTDDIPVADIRRFESEFQTYLDANRPEIFASIRDTKDLTPETDKALVEAIAAFKKGFAVSA
jgi:F-type H+-transporting ATPase subunit alpha